MVGLLLSPPIKFETFNWHVVHATGGNTGLLLSSFYLIEKVLHASHCCEPEAALENKISY